MAERVRVRRLTDEEGRKLQRLVRRGEGKGKTSVVRYRRALVVLASAGGNTVPAIARLVHTSEDRVREMIHRFNEMGMASLDPKWAGGRPRLITTDDENFIVETAKSRPESLGRPFTHWSIRKLRGYLADNPTRVVVIGRERLRQLLARHHITFQRTKTWKESNDSERDPKLARIDEVTNSFPDAASPSTSSAPWPSTPSAAAAGPRRSAPSGCGPTTTRPAGCGSSTPATRWATTPSGVWSVTARA